MRWRSRSMSSTLTLHLLADLEHLGRVVDVAPRELGDVDQAVDAVEVHERAELDDVGDDALDHLAGLELVEDLLAHLAPLVLEHRAPGEHHVVPVPVQLDDLALELAAEELVEVLDPADVHQRGGQEPAHAEVEDQAALDDLDDRALDVLAGGGRGLDALPRLLEARALLGEDQAAVLVLLLHDQRVDPLAEGDLVLGLDALADRQLGERDDALALVADVDQDLVLVDPDHPPGDHVPLREDRERQVVVRHHARRRPRCTRGRRGRGPGLSRSGCLRGRGLVERRAPPRRRWRARAGQWSWVEKSSLR